jgi:hypothetical protein
MVKAGDVDFHVSYVCFVYFWLAMVLWLEICISAVVFGDILVTNTLFVKPLRPMA